jgi:hypothetical protein
MHRISPTHNSWRTWWTTWNNIAPTTYSSFVSLCSFCKAPCAGWAQSLEMAMSLDVSPNHHEVPLTMKCSWPLIILDRPSDLDIAQGPEFVFSSIRGKGDWTPADGGMRFWRQNFIIQAISAVREKRKIKDTRWDATEIGQVLVVPVNGGTDMCDRCHLVRGTRLYSAPNYDFLLGDLTTFSAQTLFPGNLYRNTDVKRLAAEYVNGPHWSFGAMMSDLFDRAEEQNSGGGWSRDQRLCVECVKEFITDHFYLHLRHREGTSNLSICFC